jgi:hypothetical protein
VGGEARLELGDLLFERSNPWVVHGRWLALGNHQGRPDDGAGGAGGDAFVATQTEVTVDKGGFARIDDADGFGAAGRTGDALATGAAELGIDGRGAVGAG